MPRRHVRDELLQRGAPGAREAGAAPRAHALDRAGRQLRRRDRTLHLFKPPVFDGPTTRGLYDSTTAAMWIVDTFPCLTPGAVHDVHELPGDFVAENIRAMNSLVSPWHQWLDPVAYGRHVDNVEAFGVIAIASAHGPVLTRDAIPEAFDIVRDLAGQPIIPAPGQEVLDALLAAQTAA